MNSKANILIDKSGRARLTDFGLTSITRGENHRAVLETQAMGGTTTWAAPEILKGGAVTKEGDIFTFAMVAVEVRATGFSTDVSQPTSYRRSPDMPPFL